MITAAAVPVIDADPDALDRHATSLGTTGGDYADTGAEVHSTWQGLRAHYRAPEAEQLFAATGPVQGIAGAVGDDVAAVGGALATFADEVREIRDRLDALRGEAAAFETASTMVVDPAADPATTARDTELRTAVDQAMADYEEAQRRCAAAIAAQHGGTALPPPTVTAPDLRFAAADASPGGTGPEPDDQAIEDGNWFDDALSAVDGVTAAGAQAINGAAASVEKWGDSIDVDVTNGINDLGNDIGGPVGGALIGAAGGLDDAGEALDDIAGGAAKAAGDWIGGQTGQAHRDFGVNIAEDEYDPEWDFDGTGFSQDEVEQFVALHAENSDPDRDRPTDRQIHETIEHGIRTVPNSYSFRYDYRVDGERVWVFVNHRSPLESTTYYPNRRPK